MSELIDFFVRSRHFLLFLLLEVVCFYFIINSNNYWSAQYFNTSSRYVAQVVAWSNAIREFAHLREANAELAAENQRLNAQLTALRQLHPPAPAAYRADSTFANRFTYTVAKVLNSSTQLANNYLTIDKGSDDGIRPGMGVVSASGIVGKVRSCNPHFSVVTSILHAEFFVSSRLTRSNEIGSVRWDGGSPFWVKLQDISRYKPVSVGDSVVTSGFNSTFPPDILIGRVRAVSVQPNETFHDITVRLTTNFTTLSFVYVIQNRLKIEQDQIEKQAAEADK